MKYRRSLLAATLIAIIAAAVIAIGMHGTKTANSTLPQQSARIIPEGTKFAEVRKLSVGNKPACLMHDTSLDQTVQADDKLPYDKSMSTALGTVILDMPAGYTTTYLHTYTSTRATGYEVFSDKTQRSFVGNLKSFNFSIERSSAKDSWKLKSFIACSA